jgi:hypothetical protein
VSSKRVSRKDPEVSFLSASGALASQDSAPAGISKLSPSMTGVTVDGTVDLSYAAIVFRQQKRPRVSTEGLGAESALHRRVNIAVLELKAEKTPT